MRLNVVSCLTLFFLSLLNGVVEGQVQVFSLRLTPGMEVKSTLEAFVRCHRLRAVSIVTGLGSVSNTTLILPRNAAIATETFEKSFILVALSGVLGQGYSHLHVALTQADGSTLSGHVIELVVHRNIEVVLMENLSEIYYKDYDPNFEMDVLGVKKRH